MFTTRYGEPLEEGLEYYLRDNNLGKILVEEIRTHRQRASITVCIKFCNNEHGRHQWEYEVNGKYAGSRGDHHCDIVKLASPIPNHSSFRNATRHFEQNYPRT